MKLMKLIYTTSGVSALGISMFTANLAMACPGGGNWCSYHPVRSGDSEGLCSHIATDIAKGKIKYDANRKCHSGNEVVEYYQYIK